MKKMLCAPFYAIVLAAMATVAAAHEWPPPNSTVLAYSAGDLLNALAHSDTAHIILMRDITVHKHDPFPVLVSAPTVTISGPGSPNFTGPGELNYTGSVILDFNGLFPIIEIAPNATLELENLHVTGVAPAFRADVAAAVLPHAKGVWLWPAIIANPYSTTVKRNILQRGNSGQPNCSEAALGKVVLDFNFVMQSASSGYNLDPPSVWTTGNHTLNFEVTQPAGFASNVSQGFASVIMEGVTGLCFVDPYLYPHAATASDPGLSEAAIAGIAMGSVLFSTVIVVAIFSVVQRSQRKVLRLSLPTHQCEAGAPGSDPALDKGAQSGAHRVEAWVATNGGMTSNALRSSGRLTGVELARSIHSDLGFAARMRVKLGGLEGLEIGGIIGRGAHGRVYKGSFRGVNVAIKVVEHEVGVPRSTPESARSEAIMLMSLSHPNILKVYRVATIRLQQGASVAAPAAPTPSPLSSSEPTSLETVAAAAVTQRESAVGHKVTQEAHTASLPASRGAANGSVAVSQTGMVASGSSSGLEGVVSFLDSGLYEYWLVLEFCERGSVLNALQRRRFHHTKGVPNLDVILGVLIDVAEGVNYLHSNGIIHGDLKLANILLKSGAAPGSLEAVVADFGLSRILDADAPHKTMMRTASLGTAAYMAPELLTEGKLSLAADAWAMGCMAWELYCGKLMYEEWSPAQIHYSLVVERQRLELPEGCPAEYAAVVEACMQTKPKERCGFVWIAGELRALRARVNA